jgi:hypothetical protein
MTKVESAQNVEMLPIKTTEMMKDLGICEERDGISYELLSI